MSGAGGALCVGVDFGTESARALLLDASSGESLGVSVLAYPSGAIDATLPSTGEALGNDWALQDPDDWMLALERTVAEVVAGAGVDPAAIVGVGVDFTCCTVLPVTSDGEPLCRDARFRPRPHAWPKLWKHHAAQPVADRLNEVAAERGEAFLARYGGRISSEWYFPKLIEIWSEDREVHDACDAFVEAGDWVVWQMTGTLRRCSSAAGYKAFWSPQEGLPPVEYFTAAYPGFDAPAAKLGTTFHPLGTRAGELSGDAARRMGLTAGTAVAVGNVDAFASVPGCGVQEPGVFTIAIGTSICDMVVSVDEVRLPGITGVVQDGMLPGLFGYEAGQAAVGDMLAWFVRLLDTPSGAQAANTSTFAALEERAAALAPGETGLVALDWFNGNRSILADADLTGVIAGMTLRTGRAEIYRALLEAIALGSRRIMDNFSEHGIALHEIVACGGIAERSPLTMQLLADTSGRPVRVPDSAEIPARGAALFGAVAAGVHADIGAAIDATRPADARRYAPDPAATAVYDRVYAVYRELYETLGRAQVGLLHELKRIRNESRRSP